MERVLDDFGTNGTGGSVCPVVTRKWGGCHQENGAQAREAVAELSPADTASATHSKLPPGGISHSI